MDNKKHKFEMVKDNAEKFNVSGLHLEIKAKKDGALLECYQPNLKNKNIEKKK